MTDKNELGSLKAMLNIAEEAKKLQDNGANNTQIRAFMEENGFSKVKFHNDDIGVNPGIEPTKHFIGQQSSYAEGIQKAYDELLANGTIPDNIPLGIPHLEGKLSGGLKREELTAITAFSDPTRQVGFDLPIIRQKFGPTFDAAVARRHLYKDLLIRMNEEINKGPLKGMVIFTGVTHTRIAPAPIQFVFSVTWSHKSRNRMKAYDKYFNSLKTKYLLEIIEAEAKVMERE